MNVQERQDFVRSHRVCVFGYNSGRHGPPLSLVYYVMDGDDVLVSTMAERGKAKAVQRDSEVSLCVLDEQWPPSYLLVYCRAALVIDFEQVVDLRMRIAGVMAGREIPESHRPDVAETSRKENRVMLRCTPYATFETPPRHVARPEDVKGLTHWLGSTLPWSED